MLEKINELEDRANRETPDIGHDLPIFARGRLTLSSGVPVMTADVSGAATLYFTPYLGCYDFDEVSLALGALAANTVHDIFLRNLVTLSATAWANDTTRATNLFRSQGYLSLLGDASKRYLGSIRINATGGQTDMIFNGGAAEGTPAKLFVWNNYNRVVQRFSVREDTANWAYAVAAWRQMNADTDNQVEFIHGLSEDTVTGISQAGMILDDTEIGILSIGLDAVNAVAAGSCEVPLTATGITLLTSSMIANYNDYPGIGYHYLAPIEKVAAGVVDFLGITNQAFRGVIHG